MCDFNNLFVGRKAMGINMSKKRNDINFDFNRVYNINTATLTIKRQDPNLGITERNKTYKLDDIDKVHGMERELLRLTDKQTKKLMIKLDLDYTPYYISKQLIEDCIAYGDDKLKDLIIDKTIESVPASFMKYLAGGKDKKYWKVTTKIANYWVKNGKLPNPVNYITSLCKRYLKGSSDQKKGDNSVSISTGLNPINMEALTNRLQIPDSVAYGGLLFVGTWSFEYQDAEAALPGDNGYVDGGGYSSYTDASKNLTIDKIQDEGLEPGWFWIVSSSR
jgi:hypothetical protein